MNLFELDALILKIFNQPFLPYLNYFFLTVIYSVYIYIIGLLYMHYKSGDKTKISHLVLVLVIGILFVNALKFSIGRPRPYEYSPDANKILIKTDPSFPSAHVFIAFMCWYFIPKNSSRIFKIFSSIYLLVLIPLGSMYVGVHYPSDILAGAAIGLLMPRVVSNDLVAKLAKRF